LSESTEFRIDYLALVDAENLEPVDAVHRPALLAVAGFYDDVRLIDHVEIL
jgi:pantothenate synthetase